MGRGASPAGNPPLGPRRGAAGPGSRDPRRLRVSPRIGRDLKRLARHQPSHRQLLAPIESRHLRSGRGGRIDVIVIPTSRPFASSRPALVEALRLAGRHGARLLVLCSGEAAAADFPGDLSIGETVVAIIDMSKSVTQQVPQLRFNTDHLALSDNTWTVHRDVAAKRNLALLMARALGWEYVLFLDDDIKRLEKDSPRKRAHFSSRSVSNAFEALRSGVHDVVGWTMTDFPDNSVVCHARRLVGQPQESFIGGGSLAVHVTAATPFFPNIYNEDWLFLYPLLRSQTDGRLPVGEAGSIGQQEFDPFREERAASEEFGDILAEGLFGVIGRQDLEALIYCREYWEQVICARKVMIKDVIGMLDKPPIATDAKECESARLSLMAAEKVIESGARSESDLARLFVRFVRKWIEDLKQWRSRLERAEKEGPAMLAGILYDATIISAHGGSLDSFTSARPAPPRSAALTWATELKASAFAFARMLPSVPSVGHLVAPGTAEESGPASVVG
jgi:hypothetical protein